MGRAPSSGDSPSGSPTGLIDVQVGEVYDNVRTVAENIDSVTNVSNNMSDIVNADSVIVEMQAIQAATEQAASDADADRLAAANSAATAAAQVPLAQNQVTLAANQVTLAANQVTLATNQANAAAASATTAQNWATSSSNYATAADNARAAAVTAQLAAEQAADNAAAGAAFGTLGGAPEDNALLATALNGKVNTSLLGANNGVATLNSAGQLYTSQLPAISFIDTYERASEAEMLGLIVQKGDVCVRSDINKSYIANGGDSTTLAGWTLLRTPTDAVLSVNGLTGAVTLSAADIGAASTADLANYMPKSGGTFSGAVTLSTNLDLKLRGGSLVGRDTTNATDYGRIKWSATQMYLQSSSNRFSFYNVDATTELARLDNGGLDLKVGKFSVNGATVPTIGGDGGMEVGSYIDMHTAADGADFKVRFLADVNGRLDVTAAQGMYVNGIAMPDVNYFANYVPKASNIGNADLNAAVTSGFHRYDVPTNGPGTGFNYAPLIVARANDTIAQIAFSYNTGDMAWRAGNPPQTGGGASWGAWDKISNYAKLSGPLFTGTVTLDASISQVLRGGSIIGRDTTGATEYGRLSFSSTNAVLRGANISLQNVAGTVLASINSNGDGTFVGGTLWLSTNKALWQHDGSNAYFRSQVGDLHLGAGGNTKLSINGTSGAITAIGPITVNVGAQNTGIDLASNDCYANLRVQRNTNASMPGMWFGYGGAAGNLTFCPGGMTTGMLLDTSNNLTVTGNVTAYSDRRIKTNIETIESALDKVEQMRGVSYNRKDNNTRSSGVIAQELREIAPELVLGHEDEGRLSVNYNGLTGYLIEAIKELRAEVAELRRAAA